MMKNLFFAILCLLSCVTAKAKDDGLGLFYAYSMEDNKYEDSNIKLEIIGNEVYLTNKLQEVIYLDPKKTFFYEIGSGINKTNTDIIMSVQPNSRIQIHTFYEGFDKYVFTTRNDIGEFALAKVAANLGKGNGIKGPAESLMRHCAKDPKDPNGKLVPNVCPQDDAWINFIGVVGDLYNEKKENKKKTCTSVHLTKDESILTEKVALAYSLSSDYSNPVSIVVSTWVSDVFLADYNISEGGGTKKSDGFVSRKARYTKISINANSPLDNLDIDQETSPIRCYKIAFGKGVFAMEDIWANRGRVVFEGEK